MNRSDCSTELVNYVANIIKLFVFYRDGKTLKQSTLPPEIVSTVDSFR